MEQLFNTKPKFEKTAGSRKFLGQDSTTWVKEIIRAFLNEYPMLQTEPLTVTWERNKFEKGFAVGKLNVPSVNVTVPIIVKDWILLPMDTINKDGVFLPLNDFTAEELFTSRQPFKAVSKNPKTELTLFSGNGNLQFSPTGESSPVSRESSTSKTRDAVKVGSFIDHITNVNREDVENILTEIQDNNLLDSFEENGTDEVIEKLGTIKIAAVEDDIEALVRDLDLDISYVYEDKDGNTFLKQANSKVDHVWETEINEQELDSLKVKTVTNESETFKFASYETQEVSKADPTIGDCGYFKTGEETTPSVCIVNITKTADTSEKYAVYNCGNGYIALTENHDYFLNDKDNVKTASTFEVKGSEPQLGDYGIWVIDDTASDPFEVQSLYKSATPGDYEIIGDKGLSKVAYYPIHSKEASLIPYDRPRERGLSEAYYVPGNAKFVKLSKNLSKDTTLTEAHLIEKIAKLETEYGLLKIAGFNATSGKYQFHLVEKTENDSIEKVSEFEYNIPLNSEFITTEQHKVEHPKNLVKHACGKDSAGLYYFDGPEFNKYAETHSIRDLNKDEAIWTLLHCKGSEDDIKKLAELSNGQYFTVDSKLQAPVSLNKIAQVLENAVESFDTFMPLKRNLVKHAAVMSDKSTVDAVLSLGMINKKNLLEYVSLLPNYEVILSQLAELLLMTRLGMSGVNEEALADTIESFSQVVKGLKEIEGVVALK